ncbi:MAG: hypothetical protein UY10_C0004G0005 [Microgenomates group bacterium GW2011_GWA2_47_8]|nr:MAG: hypothetical protein UY10_C0004G0005 [Microgenomates group bacterium GW2011_GWA2_47_8]
MRITPALGSVVGPIDDSRWGQVFISPTAYGVVEIEDSRGNARNRGVGILTKLSQQLEIPPKSLRVCQEVAIKVMEEGVVSLLLLVPIGRVLYIVLLGEGTVFLKRGEQLSCLMNKVGAISGEVSEGDTVALISRSAIASLPREAFTHVFDHLSALEVAEKLTLLLHETHGGNGAAALIFQVKGLIPIEEDAPVSSSLLVSRRGIASVIGDPRRVVSFIRRKTPASMIGVPRRPMAIVTIVLGVLFLVSVVLGVRKQMNVRKNTDIAKAVASAQHALDEGVALFPLNSVKGRERLTQAKDILAPIAAGISPKSKEGRDIALLYGQIIDNLTLAMQITKVEPQLFFDPELIKKGATIHALGRAEDTLVLLDRLGKTVFTLGFSSKSNQIVAGGEGYDGALFVAIHGDIVYTLTKDGVNRVSTREKKTIPQMIKTDAEWGMVGAMISYGGNLYLLDTQKSRIWKYIATDAPLTASLGGFSELREYLNPDTLPDFSRATGIAVDGSVWIGTSDGRLMRFTQGKENTFVAQGVTPGLGQYLAVYTSDDEKSLYVLDRDNKRVVVLTKDGLYVSQYTWERPMDATQLVVSEKLKRILLLADGKLYSVELK